MGYKCSCGWQPTEGSHLSTSDYKAIFKHEKECKIYIANWERLQKENRELNEGKFEED